MRRREAIGLLAMALFGGCSQGSGQESANLDNARSNANTPSPGPTPYEVTPSPEPVTVTEEHSETPPDNQEPSTEQTETPSETTAYEDPEIEEVQRHLEQAVSAYTVQAPSGAETILEVNAAIGDFSAGAIHVHTNKAKEAIEEARRSVGESAAEALDELESVRSFLVHAAPIQAALVDSHNTILSALAYIGTEDYGKAQPRVGPSKVTIEKSKRHFEQLRLRSDPTSTRQINSLSPEIYDAKLQQFEDEVAVFEAIQSAIPDYVNARKAFEQELVEFGDRDDEYSSFDSLGFEDVVDTLESAPRPASIGDALDPLLCRARIYAKVCNKFEQAIEAWDEDNNDRIGNKREAEGFELLESLDEC